jgi:lysophospholipase
MNSPQTPKSNYKALSGARLAYALTNDGKKIRYALWPAGDKGLIIFLNGRNEYIEKYNDAYARFQALGYAVVTLDWRSQGLSERPSWNETLGHVETFQEYQLDLSTVLNQIQVKKVNGERILVGHSTGACIGLRTVLDGKLSISGAIFLSPFWGFGSGFGRPLTIQTLTFIIKIFNAIGLGKISSGPQPKQPYVTSKTAENNSLTTDAEQFERLQKIASLDPRLSIGPPSFSWIAAALSEIKELQVKKRIRVPSIVLIGADDIIVSQKAAKAQLIEDPQSVFKIYKNAKHELLIEKVAITKTVWENIEAFLAALQKY